MKKPLCFAIALFYCSAAFGNGDPTDRISALTASANPTPLTITDVQLISEHLWIRPGYYTEVRVRYVLLNNSDGDYDDIDYGFPIDYAGEGEERINSPLQEDDYSDSRGMLGWHDDYIRNVVFFADGAPLEWNVSKETTLVRSPEPVREDYEGEYGEEDYDGAMDDWTGEIVSRRWFYTRFSIKAGESLTLEVNYRVRNSRQRRSTIYNFGGAILDDGYSSFTYDLSPASHWGDGRVRDLFVEIDARDIVTDSKVWGKESVRGLPFRREGGTFRYEAANFAFEGSAPLEFDYLLRREVDPAAVLRHRVPRHLYDIHATGTAERYPVENLSDADLSTAWVAASDGKGQKITITLKRPAMLTNIFIAGGYLKSGETFTQNSRPKQVSVNVTGQSRSYDSDTGKYSDDWVDDGFNGEMFFQSELAAEPFWENIGLLTGDIHWDGHIPEPFMVSKIEITIDEVHPGSKYTDLCVSEIVLVNLPGDKYP